MSFLSILNPFRKATPAFIGPVASPTASDARCDSEGFYQHLGECWNDSIQMIFLFSDGIKEIVQPALLDPNFDSKVESIINHADNKDLFLFKSDLKGLKTTNLGAVNNPFANNSSKRILASKVRERKNAIIGYFKVLKKRFMRHYTNEHLRRDSLCDTESAKDHSMFQTMSQISRAAGQDGISAAALGHVNTGGVNRSHINIDELKKKSEEEKYSSGGSIIDDKYLFELYKLVFFDNYEFKYNVFNKISKSPRYLYDKPIVFLDLNISKDIIQNSKAVFIASGIRYYKINEKTKDYEINEKTKEKILAYKEGHATAFYTCGNSEIYYEDNSGIYPFHWKKFLLMLVDLYEDDETTTLIYGKNTQTGNLVDIKRSSYYPIIRKGSREFESDQDLYYSEQISKYSEEINEMEKTSLNNKQNIEKAKSLLDIYTFLKKDYPSRCFIYYTFINDSPLLESKDGHFEYNGVSITVPDEEIRSTDSLIFMTINNDQSINTQRFNQTARHGSFNWDYFDKLIEQFDLKRSHLDAEKMLQILNEYIQSNNFNHYKFYKDNLSYKIGEALTKVRPPNPELNNKLLEIAEAQLDPTDVEKLRKLIPKPPSLYPNLPSPPQSYTPQPSYSSYPFLAKGQSPHVGGYRKRKTRYQKRLIKRKTQKKRRSRR